MNGEDAINTALIQESPNFLEHSSYREAYEVLKAAGEHVVEDLETWKTPIHQQKVTLVEVLEEKPGHISLACGNGAVDEIERNLCEYIVEGAREHLGKIGTRLNAEKCFQLFGVRHDFLCSVNGKNAEAVPSGLAELICHLHGFGDGFGEKLPEEIEWKLLAGTAKGCLIRRPPIRAFLVREARIAVEPIQHLLVSEAFTGADHVDDEGKDYGEGQPSFPGEVLGSNRSRGVCFVLWKEFLKKLKRE